MALNVAHAEGVRLSHPEVDAVLPGQNTEMSVRGDPREVQHGRVQRDCCSGTRFDVDPLKSEEDLQGNPVLARRGWGEEAEDNVVRVSFASVRDLNDLIQRNLEP